MISKRTELFLIGVAVFSTIVFLLVVFHTMRDEPYSGEFVVVDKFEGGKSGTRLQTCQRDGANCRWLNVNAATYEVYPVGSTVEIEEGTVLLLDHVRP